MGRGIEPGASAQALFAAELARLRQEYGLSQVALGVRIGCHRTLISHIERGTKRPKRNVAEALDVAFGLTKKRHFTGIYERMIREMGVMGWFGRWLEVEPQALSLRFWDPMLVPGILQTEAYARAIYQRAVHPKEVEQRVAQRMERRNILNRDEPPRVWVMMDETILMRPVGGPRVLHEQLHFLLQAAEHPSVTIQVVPIAAGCTPGLLSAFAMARLPNDVHVATIQSAGDGLVTAEPRLLSRLTARCDSIRDDAYSQKESLALIERMMKQWAN
ncbi:helix-turn-helix transcriptional regulator [Spongiactinospora sp. 9N601]|uniref:helix-turn-helix transcriptional regulator n=1 Tax=Spongiactinospora sp. 9N601 TaxID=3375149 RepID=UPI00379E71BE